MTKLTPIRPEKLEKLIFSLGFSPLRQKGSHVFYKHPDGRCTTIPFHGGKEIKPNLLLGILKEINLERDEYFRLLGKK
jgi:predicted RNA binding protein YcfA (HicA-like mRNA interferase family)